MINLGTTSRIRQADGWAELIELSSVFVTVVEGPDRRSSVELPVSHLRIGTDPENDLVLTDPAVSRFHLTISRTGEGLAVADLGSTNGTFVGDVRLRDGVIPPGALLRLGSTVLKVEVQDSRRIAVASPEDTIPGLVGESKALQEVIALIRAVATSPITVLLEGETGTGKEIVARAIHDASRRTGELVAFDCASISKDLIHTELFGHKGGAFTGAAEERAGACRVAHRGTLFIDEVGDLPGPLQATFLRFLERREIKPLGMDRPIPVDVRVISATHVDLDAAVERGDFREDLYHRLKVVKIRLPPLRERAGDIPLLIDYFSQQLGTSLQLSDGARARLQHYPWPGNVRELRHMVERLSVLCRGRVVKDTDLELKAPARSALSSDGDPVDAARIRQVLAEAQGNKALAARLLGIGRSTFFRKLKELGIDDEPE